MPQLLHARSRRGALTFAMIGGAAAAFAAAPAFAGCPEVLAALGPRVADATCFESADLTTQNAATTPANNSLPGAPPGAYTPLTDRALIAPEPGSRPPITRAVPGLQIGGRFADDPTGQARFLLRLPEGWNGRLVVAGAPGTRSEHAGDVVWSDFVVQRGYAYASQNKGVWNLEVLSTASPTPPPGPPACRLNPSSQVWVHFFDDDPGKSFEQWTHYMIEDARIAQLATRAHYGRRARYVYAVGTSNGGYQVRRAIEQAPELFDGGVDWEGTFIDPQGPNLLLDLPPAIANYPAYAASGFDGQSLAARNIEAAGYPPDVRNGAASLWALHWASYWEVTQCQWQKRFDPEHVTYPGGPDELDGTGGYDYLGRVADRPAIAEALARVATTGRIRRPLVTVAGTLDALLPVRRAARPYQALVWRHLRGEDRRGGRRGGRGPTHRLYEVQNGNHIDSIKASFPRLELVAPHAQRAFELLVEHVEERAPLPPSQCVPRGGAIATRPTAPGHCAELAVP